MQQDCRVPAVENDRGQAALASRVRRRAQGSERQRVRPAKLDIVGIFPNYQTAYEAWKAKAQQTVDDAHTRYFVVHLHRLLDPEATEAPGSTGARGDAG